MERRVTATEARVHFGEVLDSVAKRGDIVWVDRAGTPLAVIVSVEVWKHRRAAAEDPWDKTNRLLRESDEYLHNHPPEHLTNIDVEEAIDAGREERDRAILGRLP